MPVLSRVPIIRSFSNVQERAQVNLRSILVVVNQRNEVLLVHRNPEARSFGGVHVFPGGNHDPNQDASLRITAIRETFEETGLLLASPVQREATTSRSEWEDARHAIHAQKLSFGEFLDRNGLKPGIDSLLPFTRWTTPENVPRRFCTQFFVAFLSSLCSRFSSGTKQEHLLTSDGGQEIVSVRFLHPNDILAEFRQKQITLMPPQFYILSTLSDIFISNANTQKQRDHIEELSSGAFGRLSINPKPLPMKSGTNGVILTYEGDETRGGPPGRLHRASVKFEKSGVTSEVQLYRNFNIFKDLEELTPSKL
ncbi:hypothetical protein APHAL10511_005747 [Amanita phalloides]|nr:hypothetical protein APHAL10511_005747 [Amanita phalloides]